MPLLDDAIAASEVRTGIEPNDLLRAVSNLCVPTDKDGSGHTMRMVALLIDGLRYGTSPPADTSS